MFANTDAISCLSSGLMDQRFAVASVLFGEVEIIVDPGKDAVSWTISDELKVKTLSPLFTISMEYLCCY